MKMCSIASGSSGNCIYVGTDTAHVLVDTGISKKRTEEGLKGLDLSLSDIDGILITHEHSDHIGGLGVLVRKREIPIYATEGTIREIKKTRSLGAIPEDLFVKVNPEKRFTIKDMTINPMHISHDAAEPVAYRICHGEKKIGIVTDLGNYNDYTVECLQGMDALLLEANHDIRMLQAGPYPYYLKQRILGDRGHLSNENTGRLLCRLLHDKLKAVVLGHLSRENNLAELAYETVRVEVAMSECGYGAADFPILVAKRSERSQVVAV